MILQLEPHLAEDQRQAIAEKLSAIQYQTTPVKTQFGDYLIGIGKRDFDIRQLGFLPGIKDIHMVSDTYKLVSRKWKVAPTVIDLGDGVTVGGGSLAIMSGPCSIEN